MAIHSILLTYYHASAAIPIANHSDFFNTHRPFHSKPLDEPCFAGIDIISHMQNHSP
jgi:hypothetical protein